MPTLGPLSASLPDLLRLLSVPVFGWAAYRDVRTRRVRNRTWYPLLALAVVLLAWDAWRLWTASGPFATADWRAFALPAAVGVGVVVPLAYAFWRVGGFGGADAKALLVLALLFPVFPEYEVAGTTLPAVAPPLETFSFTVLTNTVAFGVVYPLALALRNAARGRFSVGMFVGHEVAVPDLPERHGRLLDDAEGATGGLDLDALRMYLRWRGTTLAALRERPNWHRDPASLPAETNDPTDGAVTADAGPTHGLPGEDDGLGLTRAAADGATDGGDAADDAAGNAPGDAPGGEGDEGDEGSDVDRAPAADDGSDAASAVADPWGAAAFLDAIEGTAYGTTPASLREGLEAVAERDTVLVSPGIPFVVPMFLGLVAALTVGDVLFWLLGAVGAAPA